MFTRQLLPTKRGEPPHESGAAYPGACGRHGSFADQVALYHALKVYGTERAYKPTWAAWMFNEAAGANPTSDVRERAHGGVAV